MKIVWQYTDTGRFKKKHAFRSDRLYTRVSLCGYDLPWYRSNAYWKNDEEGLANRTACKRCLRYSEALTQTSGDPSRASHDGR